MFCARTLIRVSLILLIAQFASCIWQPNNPRREPLCDSEDCRVRGNSYKANMNAAVNPCKDFYTFACGNWLENHPGPKYAAERSVLDVMISNFAKIIRDVIESYRNDLDAHILFQRAKEVYDICVKIPEYPRSDASNIAHEVMKVGRLHRTRLWDIHTKYLKLTGESAFFRSTILGDASEGIPVLLVMEPVSAYGLILHEETWKPQEKRAYTHFLFEIIKSLNLPDTDAQINQRIGEVFEFRKKLDKIILRNVGVPPEPLNPLTAQQLETWFSDILEDQTTTQDIPWVDVMGALYHKLPLQQRHNRNLMAMRQRKYFLELMELLKHEPADVLAFHMEIYFIERHLKFNNELYKLLEGTSVEPHGLLRYIRERFYPRWETCIENHNMKEALEEMVYDKWFRNKTEERAIINQLIIATKAEIYNLMRNANWVDVTTRVSTLAQLNELNAWIGFPPWVIGEGGKLFKRNMKDILKPNASLNMGRKSLYIHASLLLSPIFNIKLPAIYNYAGLGTTVGHELYHVINACGNFLKNGVSVVWWSDKIRNECFKRLNSFIITFNQITDREFKNRYNVVVKSDTQRTTLEDYPDVMGLEAAYNVYKDSARKNKSVCQTLPNFEKYSCDQMFYIAFANTYCGHLNKKSAMKKLESADHSIESIRINGAVSQMESFGEAFGCPIESPMNPLEKTNLWH